MVISINFKWVMTKFNVIIIIICPFRESDLVTETPTTSGAIKAQQGFIHVVDTNSKESQKQNVSEL